jgi:hypothetical protein
MVYMSDFVEGVIVPSDPWASEYVADHDMYAERSGEDHYVDLVLSGRDAWDAMEVSAWTLGDLAGEVVTVYGEGRLEKYAKDVGVAYNTLRGFRRIAQAFPENDPRGSLSIGAAKVLASHPDRLAIAAAHPEMTVAEARQVAGKSKTRTRRASNHQECPTCQGKGWV